MRKVRNNHESMKFSLIYVSIFSLFSLIRNLGKFLTQTPKICQIISELTPKHFENITYKRLSFSIFSPTHTNTHTHMTQTHRPTDAQTQTQTQTHTQTDTETDTDKHTEVTDRQADTQTHRQTRTHKHISHYMSSVYYRGELGIFRQMN